MTSWDNCYLPPHGEDWQGRKDGSNALRFHEVVRCVNLLKNGPVKNQIALIGFASDTGVIRNLGRPGAKEGPQTLRKALAKLPVHLSPSWSFLDVGTVICPEDGLEQAQTALAQIVESLLKTNCFPIVLGGGHELAWGHYQGVRAFYKQERLGIINCDAHLDLRDPLTGDLGTSGSSFYQIAKDCQSKKLPFHYLALGIQRFQNNSALFDRAQKLGTKLLLAETVRNPAETFPLLEDFIGGVDHLFVSLCLDVFAAAFAPGVSAPQPFGLFPHELLPLLIYLAHSKKMATFHIAELAPSLDKEGHTAALAAELLSKMIHQLS